MLCIGFGATSQTLKEKMLAKKNAVAAKMKKDNSAMFECGYVHKESVGTKLNPMRALQKGMGNAMTDGANSDLGTAAISVFYQAHLHPQGIMRFPTKTEGWQTCGDAVFAGFTNREGTGLSSTDGQFLVNGTPLEPAGMGTYFHGFDPNDRGEKEIEITSSNGNKIQFKIGPCAPLEILSINGKSKSEELIINGTQDVVIQLKGGDSEPKSDLHVQLVSKVVGTPIIYDVIVTKAKNTIIIPKEAFKNYEGSPAPFAKENAIIVNRVNQKILDHTDAGAIRTLSAYMDWMPVTITGEIAKGSIMTSGFDTTKNTHIEINVLTDGDYKMAINKGGPYQSPPVQLIKRVAFASFVVRGNLSAVDISTSYTGWRTKTTKWFPELDDQTWIDLANALYSEMTTNMTNEFGWEILPLKDVINTEAYKYIKPISQSATKNFAEVGAGNTQRILTTSSTDLWEDLSISFCGDFVSQRLVKELDVDAVFAVTIDLNFNFETEGLDPVINLVAFAPDVSYKTPAKYFALSANTSSKPLADSRKYSGGEYMVLYQMTKMKTFNEELIKAISQLSQQEDQYPVYKKIWTSKLK